MSQQASDPCSPPEGRIAIRYVSAVTSPISTGTRRGERIAQVVTDLSGPRLSESRVLDLGCNNGGFSLRLAQLGAAEVVGIEGREANLAEGLRRRDAEGLSQVEFVNDDVRTVTRDRYGEFDVVLCLGLLYHLDVPDVFESLFRVAELCRGYALIETQVGLATRETVEFDGEPYSGLWYDEDISRPGASLDNPRSFWLTKPSLVNLVSRAGFTSVAEVLAPVIPPLAVYRDHVLLTAVKGTPLDPHPEDRMPEARARMGHPAQGIAYRVRDHLARRKGGGLPSLFN
jgi:SAM-dependent methyltransferase